MNDERSAMEGRKALKNHVVHSPEILLTFPYDPVGLAGEKLELRHGELRRNYLHWIINCAVSAVDYDAPLATWQVTGYAAVGEWIVTL